MPLDPRDALVASMGPRNALAAPKEMPAMPKAMPALMPMPKACLTSGPHVTRRPESLAHLHEPKRTRVKEQPDSTDDDTEQPVGTNDEMDKWPDEKDDHTYDDMDDTDDGTDDRRKYVNPYMQAAITMGAGFMVQRLPSGRPIFSGAGSLPLIPFYQTSQPARRYKNRQRMAAALAHK